LATGLPGSADPTDPELSVGGLQQSQGGLRLFDRAIGREPVVPGCPIQVMPVELLIRTAQLDYEHLDPQAQ
jgi:hypothetical protein